VNYFSLTAFDLESVGILPVSIDYTIGACPVGSIGPDCSSYTDIQYDQTVTVTNGVSAQYKLPTMVNSQNYVQNLNIATSGNVTGASISYRLSGPVTSGVTYDGVCADLSKSCQIPTPPMTRSNSSWFITVTAANLNFTVHANTCKSNAGSSCKTALNDGTKLKNSVTQSSGAQYYTFPAPAFDVAVGGLDGYDQTDFAPNISVQIDNVPSTSFVLSSGINAKSNRLTINMTDSPLINENSTFIVFVDAKGSFGIWIPNDNSTCPSNCSGVGNCSDYTCACPTGKPEYNGLGCEHEVKSFTIEYVILIAVGGLLVLSIVIGVPVYCWMNRHPEYETVA